MRLNQWSVEDMTNYVFQKQAAKTSVTCIPSIPGSYGLSKRLSDIVFGNRF